MLPRNALPRPLPRPILALVVGIVALALAGCAAEQYPQTTLAPLGEAARVPDDLFMTTVKWAAVVFVLVEGALLFTVFRFRGRPDDPELQARAILAESDERTEHPGRTRRESTQTPDEPHGRRRP